jgi:ABC-type transport system substrate-binding protein
VPYYDPTTKSLAPRYNPADAQRIISANHVSGTFTLLSSNLPTVTATDELIQAELANIGIKVNIVSKPTPDYISLAQKADYDIAVERTYAPDASVLYSSFNSTQETSGGLNFTFYKSAYLDRLTVQGQTTFNNKKAYAAYSAAQRFILRNVIADPLVIPVTIFGVHNNIQGFHTDVTGLWPLFQDLWFK